MYNTPYPDAPVCCLFGATLITLADDEGLAEYRRHDTRHRTAADLAKHQANMTARDKACRYDARHRN